MKTCLLALCLGAWLFTASAYAAEQSFSHIVVDVPSGWQCSEEQGLVALLAPDSSAALSIAVEKSDGLDAKTLTALMSQKLQGSTPISAGQGYSFTFTNPQGVTSTSLVVADKGRFCMLTTTGKHRQFTRIIQSVRGKTPEIKKLVECMR